METCLEEWERILKKEFKISDPDVRVVLAEPAGGWGMLTLESQEKLLDAMLNIDCGVIAMNAEVPGVPETLSLIHI